MPILLLAHPNAEEAEPIAQALTRAGWSVQRRPDAAGLRLAAEKKGVAAALLADELSDGSGFALADELAGLHPSLPVVLLARTGAALEAHKKGAHPAKTYLERGCPPEQIAREVLRAVRTLPGIARPTSGAFAVQAALRELDGMKPGEARPPTPPDLKRAPGAGLAELEAMRRRLRELEMQKLATQKELEKKAAEYALGISSREEMVRQLELSLEALTGDLSNAAVGLGELGKSQAQAHELRKELGEARAQLLAAEMDGLALREALERAMAEAHASYQRALEAEAQRADILRAWNADKAALESERRDGAAEQKHHQDELARLKAKLAKAEAALDGGAKPRSAAGRKAAGK